MANELSYDETVNIVADVEESGGESKTVVLNVKDALKDRVDIKLYYGKDAEKAADMVASLVPLNPSDEEKKEIQPQKKHWGRGKASPQQNAADAGQPKKGVGTMDKFAESAAAELRRIMPHRPGARRGQDNAPATGMVMPALSLQDQVAELERIGLGIDGNVFNSEQLKLIRMEVQALRQSSKAEKVQDENSLAAIRNRKLDEVEAKLASAGVG